MTFASVRRLMFQLHMWIGLSLGLLLVVLGLSGSLLVYDDVILDFLSPPPAAAVQGTTLPLDAIAKAAREAAGMRGQVQIALPVVAGKAVVTRVGQQQRGPGGGLRQVFIDPVNGAVLGAGPAGLPPGLAFAHQLHGNFLLGREGRSIVVGWLGVAMCVLGITGLVLWWPRHGQWKYAFFVRSTAKGLRFHRELHAAIGIWIFLVFMVVSFSGLVLAWPRTFGVAGPGAGPAPRLESTANRITADEALVLARRALPQSTPRTIVLPARDTQPVTVTFLSHDAIAASVSVDPYHGWVISVRDPSASIMAWQRPLHQGLGGGQLWRFLVFLSGLVPALFVITGVAMWWKKRRARLSMHTPLAEEA